MTKDEKTACTQYLDNLDKDHTSDGYRLLMQLIEEGPKALKCRDCRWYKTTTPESPTGVCHHPGWTLLECVGTDVDADGWCYHAEKKRELLDDTKKLIFDIKNMINSGRRGWSDYEIVDDIENLVGEYEEKHKPAHWILLDESGVYECSNCETTLVSDDIDGYQYCYRCGARMNQEDSKNG